MTIVNQSQLETAESIDELAALAANPNMSDLLFYVRDGSQSAENDKHRKVAGNVLRSLVMQLPTVTITDAAVSMAVNTRYSGSIAAFTADRNYTVPAGTAGDVIEIQLTTGDDAYELIILGATGVSINGGPAATEWSRLFISNEFVRLRCQATNDWRVEVDGRIPQRGRLRQDISQDLAHDTATKLTFGTAVTNVGSICDLASNRFLPRRTGQYQITVRGSFASIPPQTRVSNSAYVNSVLVDFGVSFVSYASEVGHYPTFTTEQSVTAGQAVEGYLSWDRSGGSGSENTFVSSDFLKPYIAIRELF
jgi:uncharacterized Zn-binding protein involved in type VI secretion